MKEKRYTLSMIYDAAIDKAFGSQELRVHDVAMDTTRELMRIRLRRKASHCFCDDEILDFAEFHCLTFDKNGNNIEIGSSNSTLVEKFVQRYESAIYKYLNTPKDNENSLIKYFIMREYENILKEVFWYDEEETQMMYQLVYKHVCDKKED